MPHFDEWDRDRETDPYPRPSLPEPAPDFRLVTKGKCYCCDKPATGYSRCGALLCDQCIQSP